MQFNEVLKVSFRLQFSRSFTPSFFFHSLFHAFFRLVALKKEIYIFPSYFLVEFSISFIFSLLLFLFRVSFGPPSLSWYPNDPYGHSP